MNVQIGQLVRIRRFLKNDDYFTCKSKIIDEDDQTEANEFR
jgi:hypothetical protein